MAKYKGKYIGTVLAKDVGRWFDHIKRFEMPYGFGWGIVQPIDVGKEIYLVQDMYSIENTDQMLARLADAN
jgi:hypothetical protein